MILYLKADTRAQLDPLLAALPAGTPIDHIGPINELTGYDGDGDAVWRTASGHHVNALLPDDFTPSPALLAFAVHPATPFRSFAGVDE